MTLDLAPRDPPLLTADLPGTGGASKLVPEDFVVEELPAYLPSGVGEHLYLWVEKRGLSTRDALERLAGALGTNPRDAGAAGQKDRHALTRQWMSFLVKDTPAADAIDAGPGVRVLTATRHANRLRTGHLRGNRFRLLLRDVDTDALPRAHAIADRLTAQGIANFYGRQRFGRNLDNALLGAALLGLADHPELARAKRESFLKRLALSALQSELFNRCLAERLAAGTYDTALDGDVLRKRDSGGHFNTTDPATDTPRVRSQELDVTGPMPGPKERPSAKGAALEQENRILAAAGVPRESFAKAGSDAEGARRPYRVPVEELVVSSEQHDGAPALRLVFALPSGSYATRVLAEFTRHDVPLPGEG